MSSSNQKIGTVCFIFDFKEVNKKFKRKPFPIPGIQDKLLKLEGFKYATSLDLNMGYYDINLYPFSRKLCIIVLPWSKYEYQKLPMRLCYSPDIIQEKMNKLFNGLEYVRIYIEDLLIISNKSFEDHFKNLDKELSKLNQKGFKVNAEKFFFTRNELEYVEFRITRQGIMRVINEVEAINNIAVSTTKKQLGNLIVLIIYHRVIWQHTSEILTPLFSITSKQAKWN